MNRLPAERKLTRGHSATSDGGNHLDWTASRLVLQTNIDMGSLALPASIRSLLAEAFWNHYGHETPRCLVSRWLQVKTFERFAQEVKIIEGTADIGSAMLLRYIEWLNRQVRADGQPWAKGYRSTTYSSLKALLKWIQRCRPGVLGDIEYPFSPFPYRNRDRKERPIIHPADLRKLLQACEQDIRRSREIRAAGLAARLSTDPAQASLGRLLQSIDDDFGGVLPESKVIGSKGMHATRVALRAHGGARSVEQYLYPQVETLLPYYLTILIHTAGNAEPILEMRTDCLRPMPLLDDRELVVWMKRRAGREQRRAFNVNRGFEPPTLIREVIEWTSRLRPTAPTGLADRLFLFKFGPRINALSIASVGNVVRGFCERHGLPTFALSSIRSSALTSFYRATKDLKRTSAMANHAGLATTAKYIDSTEVRAQHQVQIANLQSAFIGHIETQLKSDSPPAGREIVQKSIPQGEAVSMFGFGCRDPFEGIAPGTSPGELCGSFLGCFTCPNAVIVPEPRTIARMLQARDHLRAAMQTVHPSRWQAIYFPPFQIIESDILPRFSEAELAIARKLVPLLPPLPELR